MLLAFAFFLVAAYFFAFAESATIAAQRVLLHHAASEGDPRAKLVEILRDNPRRFFGTTLIGTNICIVTLSAVGAHRLLPSWGISVVLATIIVDVLILVFSEITPKTLSLSNPTMSSMKIARALDMSARILAPAIWLITYVPSRLLNIDKIFQTGDSEIITESQIVHMIGISAAQGGIETTEGERAVRVFEFADMTVEQVMTPRADMVVLTTGESIRSALHTANRSGFSRLPVLTPDGNESPGFLAAKDILALDMEDRLDEPVDAHLREIRFIPESKRILNLLGEFRTSGEQIALVVNEFGTITGLVTLEDLLEEVLGEIYDEYDRADPGAQWVRGSLTVPGRYPAVELAERLKVKFPEGDYDTAAGLILHLLGHVPEAGENVELDGWTLVATHVVRHRITRILAKRSESTREQPKPPQKQE